MSQVKNPVAELTVADQVELRVVDPATGELGRYRTSVVDITAATISVAMPSDHSVPVAVLDGTALIVTYWKGYADHRFTTQVVGRENGRVPQLVLARPAVEAITRSPRRDFFRVDTHLAAQVSFVDGDQEDAEEVRLAAIVLDLGGGGCRLQTRRRLAAGMALTLEFDLPFPPDAEGNDRTRPIRRLAGTVRSSFLPAQPQRSRGRPAIFLAGVQFVQPDSRSRSLVLRYVAYRQREVLNQLLDGARNSPRSGETEAEAARRRVQQLEEDLATRSSATEPEGPQPPALPPSGKTVLVVDDEPQSRQALAAALGRQGHEVVEAGHGLEALASLQTRRPDLVITDLMMPKMNGWRLIAALREEQCNAPVLLMTSHVKQVSREALSGREIAGFLAKPVDLDLVTVLVRKALVPLGERSPRLLIIDDDEQAIELVTRVVQEAGWVADCARTGREALNRAESTQPDLIILDIAMAGTDGFEVARRLRFSLATASLPIVLLSAARSAEVVRRAVDLKIGGFLVKPLQPQNLLERLRALLKLPPAKPSEAAPGV